MTADASAAGGAAAARTVAEAARVLAAVARVSGARGHAAQAAALERRATGLAERNSAAFARALEALRGDAGRELRTRMDAAALVLGKIAEAAADASVLAAEVARSADPDHRADAVAATVLAEAAATVAAYLVAVNLTVAADDERLLAARAAVDDARAARDAVL